MSLKSKRLKKGDTIAILSLSSGIMGEPFASHELEIAKNRLTDYGFNLKFTKTSLNGIKYVKEHPEKRAEDLVTAFEDETVDAIICAIGGDDTYKLAPFLFENDRLCKAVKRNPKIFLGFSDTTVNHLMLFKCGLNTFYGQAFIPDIAELDREMLPYTRKYFEDLFILGEIKEITSSPVWYDERKSFGRDQIGTPRVMHTELRGFEVIKGSGNFSGRILGGCLETLYDMLTGDRYPDEKKVIEKYKLFPGPEDWKGRILLLETSEEQQDPDYIRRMLITLKRTGVFDVVSGVIVGKPMDEKYYDEYKNLYLEILADSNVSVVYNINVGHATPRCIIPFGVDAEVIGAENRIMFKENILN